MWLTQGKKDRVIINAHRRRSSNRVGVLASFPVQRGRDADVCESVNAKFCLKVKPELCCVEHHGWLYEISNLTSMVPGMIVVLI